MQGDDPARKHGPAPDPSGAQAAGPDMAAVARDWIALWQSELTALAADREWQEGWATLASLWAGVAGAALRGLPRGAPDARAPDARSPDGGARTAGAAEPPRAAPAAAAPDPRDAEIRRLAEHVAELERRLAEVERGHGGRVRRGGRAGGDRAG